jgi:hypothetical protein
VDGGDKRVDIVEIQVDDVQEQTAREDLIEYIGGVGRMMWVLRGREGRGELISLIGWTSRREGRRRKAG